jgi:hypothetical protein
MNPWRQFLRPGDGLALLLGIGLCAAAFALGWSPAEVDRAVIRQGGKVVAEYKLGAELAHRVHAVDGPLGATLIELEGRRARVQADPGPRQLCVNQGWLERANAFTLCAPNQVSLHLLPSTQSYDSLHY